MANPAAAIFGLEGKRVLITGAGGGIGSALVLLFHSVGATVIACDHDAALLDALPPGAVSERYVFDLADRTAVLSASRAISPAVDVLVNNAGFTRADTFSHVTDETVEREIQLNLTGTIDLTRALLPGMIDRPGGGSNVVFVSSVNALQHFGNPIYSVAKAGQLAFVRALAVEYGTRGVRANAVCPGSVKTSAWEHRADKNPKVFEDLLSFYPMGRLVTPEEVANAVLFMASRLASGVTGQVMAVDAGVTAGNLRLINDVIGGQ